MSDEAVRERQSERPSDSASADGVEMNLRPIGTIRSPYQTRAECPANGWSDDTVTEMHVRPEYESALHGLSEGMKIHVLWWFHEADRSVLRQQYEPGSEKRGVFAMRSPARPNPLALSLCEIEDIDGETVSVVGLEALDGSKVVDVKKAIAFEDKLL